MFTKNSIIRAWLECLELIDFDTRNIATEDDLVLRLMRAVIERKLRKTGGAHV